MSHEMLCSTKKSCLRLRMICKLKHRRSSVWKNLFFKISKKLIPRQQVLVTASVFDMLHSLDDWQDHGTCDVYFAACGLVPTQRVCGHRNLRKTMQRSRQNILWLRKLSPRRKKMQSRCCKAAEREDWYRSRREILGFQHSVGKKHY